jgi:hypothetical protein
MLDPDLLQLIRQEIALFGGCSDLGTKLAFVEEDRLRSHLDRLFYGGEIEAACTFGAHGLELQVKGLTAQGVQRMRDNDDTARSRY